MLRELVDRYTPSLLAIARAFTGDPDEAQDLVQLTWVRAYQRRSSVRDDGSFVGWLWAVCRSLCLTSVRRVAGRKELHAAYVRDTMAGSSQEVPAGALEHIESVERKRALLAAVAELAPRQRDVVIMRLLEGLSTRETAETLDCATGTVKATLHQALSRLEILLRGVEL